MIKPTSFLLSLAVCFAVLFTVPASASDDQAELKQLLDQFLSMPADAIYENHDRFWAEDLVYTGSRGNRTTKQAILQSVRDREAEEAAEDTGETRHDPSYSAEDVDIRVYDTTAVVAFKLVATTGTENGITIDTYYNTGTFLKRDGVWKAVAWQATRIPKE
ncbi:hypothetical protein GCM10017044_26260 [Kordiimonas sediminis]|uniref:DUF4440 domain-containing protein n=1 Tax=Kordiimonas sediminis TaxID=1735581 RepID=A0A919AYJ0_9PROT|nr:nuclear transport factor 2 family protein [Kordiimonas sediminis]GHF29738.1 hypothetical protein GCM10017044_26260 [Kordiimonas sediminis]